MPDPEHDEVASLANSLRRTTIRRASIVLGLGLVAATAGVLVILRTAAAVGLSSKQFLKGTVGAGVLTSVGLVVALVGGIVLVRAALRR